MMLAVVTVTKTSKLSLLMIIALGSSTRALVKSTRPFRRFPGCLPHKTPMTSSSSASLASSAAATIPEAVAVSSVTRRMEEEAEAEVAALFQYFLKSSTLSSHSPKVWTSHAEASTFVQDHIDAVLFDCDGVVYRSPDPAPGARQCIQNLLSQGKKIFFVTNNAASTRRQLRDKLELILDMKGLLSEEMMVGSAFSAAQYLKQTVPTTHERIGRLYAIGSSGLCEELRLAGFDVVHHGDSEKPSMNREDLAEYDFNSQHPIDAVVVGHDVNLNFRKLCIANVLLQKNPNAPLVATNLDSHDLVGLDGRHIPGNGAAVKFLEYSSKRQAINCGKPSKLLTNLLDSLYGLDSSTALFVGDRLDTDILFGRDSGMYTALVMTGVATSQQMIDLSNGTEEETLPNFIVPHIGYLA